MRNDASVLLGGYCGESGGRFDFEYAQPGGGEVHPVRGRIDRLKRFLGCTIFGVGLGQGLSSGVMLMEVACFDRPLDCV